MKFLIDENIPFADEFFSGLGEVTRFPGRELAPEQLIDVDVLLVRSITKVDEKLIALANALKFVGTATIGEDHIDKQLLSERGIAFSSAPGCNANSVAEFVISALFVLAEKYQIDFSEKTVAVIGVGNIGQNLQQKLSVLGIELLLCDPYRANDDSLTNYVTLEAALTKADVISFHTPLTRTGPYPTYHLLNGKNLPLLKDDVCIVNASRGEVIDNQALLTHIQFRQKHGKPAIRLVLDVWEGEPNPLKELIPFCDLTTAHIAGYSLEGKAKGTEMLYKKVCELFKLKTSVSLANTLPKGLITDIHLDYKVESNKEKSLGLKLSSTSLLKVLIHTVYDVRRDDGVFRHNLDKNSFDWIRKNYPIRREWSSISVNCNHPEVADFLRLLGFNIK